MPVRHKDRIDLDEVMESLVIQTEQLHTFAAALIEDSRRLIEQTAGEEPPARRPGRPRKAR
jgi:hypothetical protein